jgi:signal transduction histidine kinase
VPSGRDDELGIAERELAAMQGQLQETLKSQKHLADLGLAVSKINHDMRNILASAQLMSDRLSGSADPAVQRFAPKLMRTLDRAVNYSENVLSYGRAGEAPPNRRRISLAPIVSDVEELLGIDPASGIEFSASIPEGFELDADSEQLFRILLNLSRNSVEAMRADRRSGDGQAVRSRLGGTHGDNGADQRRGHRSGPAAKGAREPVFALQGLGACRRHRAWPGDCA